MIFGKVAPSLGDDLRVLGTPPIQSATSSKASITLKAREAFFTDLVTCTVVWDPSGGPSESWLS